MPEITEPLRLAVGSHEAGTGAGCVMNVISWENGDSTITDFPRCADVELARICQYVNDKLCAHLTGVERPMPAVYAPFSFKNVVQMLCPECSLKVLALGHRTVGTADVNDAARKAAYDAMRRYLTEMRYINPFGSDGSPSEMFLNVIQTTPHLMLETAHELIDIFETVTGAKAPAIDMAKVEAAYEKMSAKVPA